MKSLQTVSCILFLVLVGCVTDSTDLTQAQTLKLSFVVDQQYDVDTTVGIFRSDDPAGLPSRAKGMGIDPETAQRIHDASNQVEAKKLAAGLVQQRFERHGADIQASIGVYTEAWKDLLPLFSLIVIEKTEAPWVHPEYICVVSAIHPGISNWFGNKVAVKFDRPTSYKRRILAHEMLLSDVFQLMRKRHPNSELSDWQVWAFSEITPVLILDDSRLQPFWPEFPVAGQWFSRSNYPQLAGLEQELKDIFDNRTSYKDYEDSSVAILKGFKQLPGGA